MKPEQVWKIQAEVNGKQDNFIIQNPTENNCLLVAVANLLLHDGTFTVEQAGEYIDTYTKKFDVNKRGLQIVLIGESLYHLGYQSHLCMSPGDLEVIHSNQLNGWKGIRMFATEIVSKGVHGILNIENLHLYVEWKNTFKEKYNLIEEERPKVYGEKKHGCHAVYYYDFNIEEQTAMIVNHYGINKFKWLEMSPPEHVDLMKQRIALGAEMVLMVRKFKNENII